MRTLHFCCGCSVLLPQVEIDEGKCGNCDTPTDTMIPGQFTDEDASHLETAATDQTQ